LQLYLATTRASGPHDGSSSLDVVAGPGQFETGHKHRTCIESIFESVPLSQNGVQFVNHVLAPYVDNLILGDVKAGVETGT
jgi:hypothetical protein